MLCAIRYHLYNLKTWKALTEECFSKVAGFSELYLTEIRIVFNWNIDWFYKIFFNFAGFRAYQVEFESVWVLQCEKEWS